MTNVKVKNLKTGRIINLTSLAFSILKKQDKHRHLDIIEEPKKVVAKPQPQVKAEVKPKPTPQKKAKKKTVKKRNK